MNSYISNILGKGRISLQKHSPEILMVTGITGVIASAVMACVATRKLDIVLDEHKTRVGIIHAKKDASTEKHDLTRAYIKTGMGFVKLYAPSVAVGALSITGILASNNILRKRNVALAAAYTAIDTGFRQYRSRVVDRFGAEVDEELRYDLHKEKIEVVEKDENGKEHKVKKTVNVIGEGSLSDYARYFVYGEAAAAEPNFDYNRFFLGTQQETANLMLKSHGYLFLNEVYDMLGIERSIAGQSVGWVYDKNSDDHGDNYIDFRIREVIRKVSDRPGEYEKVLLIDPNVDGNILDHALQKGLVAK